MDRMEEQSKTKGAYEMTLIEILLIILIVLVILFMLFWFFQGTTGRISLRRPVESRVDGALDRRFARLVEDYEVVRRPKLTGSGKNAAWPWMLMPGKLLS